MSIEDGIEWQVRQAATRDTDFEVSRYTGELEPASSSSTGMSRAAPADASLDDEIAEAREDFCDGYIDPSGSDPLESQGWDVRMVSLYTILAATSDDYTDELVAAVTDTDTHIQESGPEVPSFSESSEDERRQATEDRVAAWDDYFEETYPNLVKDREKILDKQSSVEDRLYTEEGVREVQEAIVEYCEITLPAGFSYPTAEELGIEFAQAE